MRLVDARVDDADLHAARGGEGAESGGVPALGRVDVGVGPATGLTRVVQAVELREQRVVGSRGGAQDVVRLGVVNERAAVQPLRDDSWIAGDLDDACAHSGHRSDRALNPGRVEQRRALSGGDSGLVFDDDRVCVVLRSMRGSGEPGPERKHAEDAKYAPAHG
jgi:hypothetical protein